MKPTAIDQSQAASDARPGDRDPEPEPDPYSWPGRLKKAAYAGMFFTAVASWLAAAASAMYFALVDVVRG